jgi:hypothetical protein
MALWLLIVPLLSVTAAPGPARSEEPLVCRLDALKPAERDRHHLLSGLLRSAVTDRAELADGFELTLDLTRLPADAKGSPFCFAEVAEWAELESRCCPFLDFQIGLRDKGRVVTLRLTGGEKVKMFLREELGLGGPGHP